MSYDRCFTASWMTDLGTLVIMTQYEANVTDEGVRKFLNWTTK